MGILCSWNELYASLAAQLFHPVVRSEMNKLSARAEDTWEEWKGRRERSGALQIGRGSRQNSGWDHQRASGDLRWS